MSVALGVLAAAALLVPPPVLDPQHLPQLPARGLARETDAGVELETMRGRPLGVVKGLDLADDKDSGKGLLLRDRRGQLFVIDLYQRRVRRVFAMPSRVPGCRLTDSRPQLQLYVCGRTVKTASDGTSPRVVARAPGRVGHWVRAEFAPRGDAFLAQWSAECEVPVAYLVAGGVMHPYGAESVALGWLPTGAAVIHFPNGPCGGGRVRGIYAVSRSGERRLLVRTRRWASYWMWGG